MSEPILVPTADLFDNHGDAVTSCDLQLRNYGMRLAFQGSVVTVRIFEDNALLSALVDEPGLDRVIVVDGAGSLHRAVLGDQMAGRAGANGWSGIVINGAIRDVSALATLDIGIKALGANPRKSTKSGVGERDVVVNFGGVNFIPGWWLVSDEDGVVLVDPALINR